MPSDDIERAALLDRLARWSKVRAASYRDWDPTQEALSLIDEAEGAAAGYAFRAAELRYDARGGMTAALERRRFEPGAAWLLRGVVRWVTGQRVRFHNIMVEFDDRTAFELGTLTRANGWLFLDLSDQGGYR